MVELKSGRKVTRLCNPAALSNLCPFSNLSVSRPTVTNTLGLGIGMRNA